jgi:hypothetical protein
LGSSREVYDTSYCATDTLFTHHTLLLRFVHLHLLLLLLLTGDDWAAALENFDTSLDAQVAAAPSKEEQEMAAAKALVSFVIALFRGLGLV